MRWTDGGRYLWDWQAPQWSEQVPTQPGLYWMFGFITCDNARPRVYLAEATLLPGGMMYVIDGYHISMSQLVGRSLWIPATPPAGDDVLLYDLIARTQAHGGA